ncbi:Alpha/beta hydrolase family-domain-containing protein [Schizophyllum fasciatum]
MASYPPPPVREASPPPPPPLALLPVAPPSLHDASLPALLPDNADHSLPGFAYSKHLVPACAARTVPASYDLPRPDARLRARKAERKAEMDRVAGVIKRVVTADEWWEGAGGGTDDARGYTPAAPLFNCLGRFRRMGGEVRAQPGLTLFFAHANGFNKETWYPTLRHLVSQPAAASHIAEIWVWEAVHHGEAAVLNRAGLQGFCQSFSTTPHWAVRLDPDTRLHPTDTWRDNTRDILNFLLHFIPAEASSSALPAHLPRVSAAETAGRRSEGLPRRHVVAVGHSFGGCTSALAALTAPRLLHSLVLVDPVIMCRASAHEIQGVYNLTSAAVGRRARWATREEAKQQFLASPFFQRWDPAVLDAYVEGGLHERDGGVELRMTPLDEALMFADARTSPEVYERVPSLREDVEIRWVIPGPGERELGSSEETRRRVWLRPRNSSNVRIEGAGHLIPQEQPERLAREIAAFVERKGGEIGRKPQISKL